MINNNNSKYALLLLSLIVLLVIILLLSFMIDKANVNAKVTIHNCRNINNDKAIVNDN